ncbi:MAG TPA: hypothetical protein VK146_05410 [Tabrizicola sp.]|nr:hypothetical protein [Tabrizicola sp.]
MKLEQGRIAGGVWEAVLSGAVALPVVEVVTGGRTVEGVEIVPGRDGTRIVKVPIPSWALNEGVQTFLVRAEGVTLASFTLIAGEPLDHDIRAELDLVRAELDLLKRAFQRHAREG